MNTYKDISLLLLVVLLTVAVYAHADTVNPCEYLNLAAKNHLDTGNDPNFTRIVQQNNQEIVRACQEYQIKQLHERTNNWNRDNY